MTTLNLDIFFHILSHCTIDTFGPLLRLNKAIKVETYKNPRLLVQLYKHKLQSMPDQKARAAAYESSLCAAITLEKDTILLVMIEFEFDRVTKDLPYGRYESGYGALAYAAVAGNVRACKALIHHFDQYGHNAIEGASLNNQPETFEYLISFAERLKERDYDWLM
ncbi:hypothetical protein HDV00_005012 [Rhizophlyctis rosea]|nr:hypothetical protein HDV00_005012 [Rhizophlyctis rosea]